MLRCIGERCDHSDLVRREDDIAGARIQIEIRGETRSHSAISIAICNGSIRNDLVLDARWCHSVRVIEQVRRRSSNLMAEDELKCEI